jgi:type VI secretion system protein ImpL
MPSDQATQLSYYFPWSLVVALLLALVFAFIGIVIFRSSFTQKEEPHRSLEETFPFITSAKLYLARFGYFAIDPLSKSFLYAIKLMQSFMGGTQFRYHLPWILILGASNAGKSTLLENLNLDKPIGTPDFTTDEDSHPALNWWFYDHGVVLDLEGDYVIKETHPTSDEKQWKLFSNLLANYRPKRALDGIVLTIPASELVGTQALSHNDIAARAEYLYGKLWHLQHITGIRLPIYVVVTKCDLIPGFKSFCKSLPYHNKRDMFGWSNDHAIDSAYDSTWIEEAFSTINQSLYRTQQEIYADGKTIDGRDGVFLFPLTLNQLKGRLKTYTDHIFKVSGYHEAFFLRGLYFVGDSHFTPLNEAPSKGTAAASLKQDVKIDSTNIYFGDDLFEMKIFREVGVARPISKLLLGNTTAIRFIKIGVAVSAILGTIALLYSNEKLQTAKMNLLPALNQINLSLEKFKGQSNNSEIERAVFDDQTHTLIETITHINVNHLKSPYIPPSWFSPLDTKIKYVMGISYGRIILRSISIQLAYKASQLVSAETIVPVTQDVGSPMDPLETIEFYRFYNYVLSIRALEAAATKFNELGTTASLKDVAAIIQYLFNYVVPEGFFENSFYYTTALKHTKINPFDFQTYSADATIKLHKLFNDFQVRTFDPTQTIPGFGSLISSVNDFSNTRNSTAYDTEILRKIFTSLQETINSINNPTLQWINAGNSVDNFDPGPQYEYTMQLIADSMFFSSQTTDELISEISQNFKLFRQKLASYTSPLIDGGTIFTVENGLAIATPSPGATSLLNNLTSFYAQSFMAATEQKSIITAIPIGSLLLWDTLRLQQASRLINDYNNFINSNLLNFPKVLQPLFQKIGRDSLTLNLVSSIVDAETFSANLITESILTPEDSVMSQVQNYRAAAPFLEQILIALYTNNANSAFLTLKSLLTTQIYAPLKTLDSILTKESPYAIKQNSFDWWAGTKMAALEAFGVTSLNSLKNYLELQRDRINYLAREFAEPLVLFIEKINTQGMPGDLPLVTKWAGILADLAGYEQKTPGNGLSSLEDFIMGPLNEVTLATCNKYADSEDLISSQDDFFVGILANIQEKLRDRCVELSGDVSVNNYTNLATFFNANLANKFPFVEKPDAPCPDAAPQDIRTFFEMMDSQAANIKATLQEAQNLGPAGKNALTFIEQMDKVRSFFGGYLVPNSTLPTPAFAYKVTFRVNQEREVRANEILNWSVVTNGSEINIRSKSLEGLWNFGNSMKVIFRWALNSPLQPLQSDSTANYQVQGEDAVFSYDGNWALLKLLRLNQANPTDFDTLNDPTPVTLRFQIPLTNATSNYWGNTASDPKSATAFISLQVMPIKAPAANAATSTTPTSTTSSTPSTGSTSTSASTPQITPGSPVTLPYFPFEAPLIDNSGGCSNGAN